MKKMAILRGAAGAAVLAASVAAVTGHAQEVVQPLPSPYSEKLSAALQRLARNAGDVDALLDAGEAALELRDVPGAMGFFGRAKDVSPNNGRVSLGLARAYTMARRPVEALRLFSEAERGGIPPAVMAKDRALAFDLVGDTASAQQLYRLALAHGAGDETVRNLALSQAISGDRSGFEATLVPLLQKNDLAAFRTRAFGLAILGDTEGAVEIAQTMMTPQVANRVAPYLRYMPRLTSAQQAAAGNLGIFPQTNAIGRDDAEIAAYSGPSLASSAVPQSPSIASGSQLIPSGPPTGKPQNPSVQPSIASSLNRDSSTATPPASVPAPPAPRPTSPAPLVRRIDVANASDPLARTMLRGRIMSESDVSAFESVRAGQQAQSQVQIPARPNQEIVQPTRQPAAETQRAELAVSTPAATVTAQPQLIGPPAKPPASGTSAPEVQPQAQPQVQPPVQSQPAVQTIPQPVVQPIPVQPEQPQSVSDAFAGFDLADNATSATPSRGAVDITSIAIPREREAPPAPPPPVHPARHWVQVATGKDLSALAFDWRRIVGKSDGILDGKGPFTTPWVEANRLLAGPYDSAKDARDVVNRLKALGVDSFAFLSDRGQEISPLR